MKLSHNERAAILLFIAGISLFCVDAPILGGICVIVGILKLID